MKRVLFIFLLITFFLIPSLVFAQDNNPASLGEAQKSLLLEQKMAREEIRQEVRNRIENNTRLNEQMRLEIQNKLQERRATQEAKLIEAKKLRIKNYFSRISTRMQAAIERLEILVLRIESRVEKIEEADPEFDLTQVKSSIADAKVLLIDAAEMLGALNTNLDEVLDSDDPKVAFEIVREGLHEIKSNLIEAHRLLVQTIGSLKGLRVGEEVQNGE